MQRSYIGGKKGEPNLKFYNAIPIEIRTLEYTFFSSVQEILTNMVLYHKTCLNNFKRIQIPESVFSDHNRIKLKIVTEQYLKDS